MNWLLANSVAALALSVVVLLIERWWRPAPSVMHGLWLVVILKLVTPPLFEVPLDIAWLTPASPAAAKAERTAAPSGQATPRQAPPAAAVPTSLPRSEPLPSSAAIVPETTIRTTLLWLWLGTSSLLLLATAWRTLRIHHEKRGFGAVPRHLRLEVQQLAERIGVSMPQLCNDPQSAAPYVWTIGRTRLVLPVQLLRSCSQKGRAAVLAHELAHLRRKDHWVARAELVLLTLLFWHPLFWFARSRMRLWAELACDAIAIETVPEANLDYATLLVDAAARPITHLPGVAVLASRPAARAAFERRLKMILNEDLPRRASRAWCVPFAGLALGLFALPVQAQQQDPDPVQIEIRINGKPLQNLSKKQQNALMEVLLENQSPSAEKQGGAAVPQPKKPSKAKAAEQTMPVAAEVQKAMQEGLAEARREILNDPDLKELGITDEVLEMIDGIGNGKGVESSIDVVVRAAMKGVGHMVAQELRDDEDLRSLGLDKGIATLITGLLENEFSQKMVGDLARTALGSALDEAKAEIRADADLQKLGIGKDVEGLIDAIVSGNGDFEGNLNKVIEKATSAAMQQGLAEVQSDAGTKVKAKKQKQAKPTVKVRRQRETIR